MTAHDPRTTLANGHAAASELRGVVEATRYVRGTVRTVRQPLVNVTDAPRGARTTQLLYGEAFRVIDERDGFSFGQAQRDGYCGWVLAAALGREEVATHWVVAPATHLYPKAAVKAPPDVSVFFGSRLRVTAELGDFVRLASGHFVPTPHVQPLRARFADPVGVAEMALGTPYLWGGCSRWGIDCSGLVQMALLACGVDCPRDSDQQEALGEPVADGAPLARGDLVFWRGHVALASDADTLIHANAHHMAVAYEPFAEARNRIAAGAQGIGSGAVTAVRRIG